MSAAGSISGSNHVGKSSSHGAINVSVSNAKMPTFPCDGCLWGQVPTTSDAAYSCMTCLHCYCVLCLRDLAKQSRDRREPGNVRWFRCPVPSCAIMIQANHQLRELSSKNLPTPLQYLARSNQRVKDIVSTQRVARFHLDNSSRLVQIVYTSCMPILLKFDFHYT